MRVSKWFRSALMVVTGLMVVVACSQEDKPFDREAAIVDLVDAGSFTGADAACWVDGVVAELGREYVENPDLDLTRFEQQTMVTITASCVADLSDSPEAGSASVGSAVAADRPAEPMAYGDDARLDRLWDACAAGNGLACDTLFWDSAPSSDYEAFAESCGSREEVGLCAELDD
ncbi:MAG: hypothetical protein GY929_11050 [Actinomycetia bacterium]|nr:hypothetical protein [Actinomycetes bacterium]